MRGLSSLIILLFVWLTAAGQSPHGASLKMSCSDCHNPAGWKLTAGTYRFTHDSTGFMLEGMHRIIDCRMCHPSLVFSEAGSECISCHTDMHNQSVGMECERCHTPASWIVQNITQIHQQSRFPLNGPHYLADCNDCHPSASLLYFEPLGIDCYDCHKTDFQATTNPNHVQGNFSTYCLDCHLMNAFSWSGAGFDHSLFPLTNGHANVECSKCHTDNNYSNTSAECYSCHQNDYEQTLNPNHINSNFQQTCNDCHTTNPGWKPAEYREHDAQSFPIYFGKHAGEWNSCTDCHQNTSNYAEFTCIDCHEHNKQDTDEEHNEVQGYVYTSIGCFECHPTGDGENSFNHNTSAFPLTGAHLTTDCIDCHAEGYAGTSAVCVDCHITNYNQSSNPNHIQVGFNTECTDCHTTDPDWKPATFQNHNEVYPLTGAHASIVNDCFACHAGNYNNTSLTCASCHMDNYNQSANPNHAAIGIPSECEQCHTTNPGWQPAGFPIHNNYYILEGAHNIIANDCDLCHAGNYNNTPATCIGCHQDDYDQTTNPSHQAAQFPTTCEECHTETAWLPSTFDHDGQYFPIYSGEHNGEWNQCSDCHQNPANYGDFTCTTACHEQGETNSQHEGISGYAYNSAACFACHPTGSGSGGFNHNSTNFPLTGAHTTVACHECHESGYSGTSTVCFDCHGTAYNQSSNPAHVAIGIPTNCDECHTTNPGWEPATFPIHNNYYPLTGAHASVSADCFACHQGNYNNTPLTCAGCHMDNYNQSVNPNHNAIGIPANCEECHTTNPGWEPATFPIHNNYYLLAGAHIAIASDCNLCHNGNYNTTPNNCVGCHLDDYNQTNDPPHASAQYPTDCEVCHNQNAWIPSTFDHDGQYFPIYSGEHNGEWNLCSDCHQNPANYEEFTCTTACHEQGETNSQHEGISGYVYNSDACYACHPTGSGSGGFNHNSTNFPLTGAHATVACLECHENGYSGTSTVCFDCHGTAYNQSSNPAHAAIGIPTNCDECHTTNPGWEPATFPIHNNYYPLTGAHAAISADCFACHQGNYNNTPLTCAGCHMDNYNQSVNPNHNAIGIPATCEECHTTNPGWEPATFPIHNNYYVLAGAHVAIANDCNLCHNGNYNTTPNTCVGCHLDDYNQTNDPPHAAAQYPTDCEVCHTQNAWIPSTFNHDLQYFPIYSGEHEGEWNTCSECHPNPANYTIFTCLTCHGQAETDREHQGVPGYSYNSNACLSCHPNGNSDTPKIRKQN